jgi:DNA topoisomerase I
MKLLIVESPAKSRKIATFLGDDYVVEASRGHICQMPVKRLAVDIEHGFKPEYEITEDKRDIVAKIQNLASRADQIFLATDPDREGEAISQHLYDILDPTCQLKCKRITYQEITKKAILAALAKPREIDSNLVDAAKARQVLDRLIGYKVSPIAWLAVGSGTSAGRVQSVALKLVCERQREIDAFKAIVYWYVDVNLGCKEGSFKARVIVPDEKDNRFLDKKIATDTFEALKNASYEIGNIQKASKSVQPFPPFDTNSLQGAGSAILKWDITKSMKVAQELYEAGKISYIRTDSFNISDEAIEEAKNHIIGQYGSSYLPKKTNVYVKKAAAGAQEAHECIRPTHIEDTGEDMEGDAKKLYEIIRDRFIACQMAPMVVDSVKYVVNADSGHKLLAGGQTISFDGFSKVWRHKSTKEETLPNASKGEKLVYEDIKKTENHTKPPDRYTDASLANKLEADGVGRPATRAPIIKSLEDKGYLTKDKTALVPTQIGHAVVDFLAPAFQESFMDMKYTAGMESEMVKMADGEVGFVEVVSKFYEALQIDISKTKGAKQPDVNLGLKCSICNVGDVVAKTGKFGLFFSCNNYPACKTVFEKSGDTYVPQRKREVVTTKEMCPKCGKVLLLRDSTYGKFLGCSDFPKCRFTQKFKGE